MVYLIYCISNNWTIRIQSKNFFVPLFPASMAGFPPSHTHAIWHVVLHNGIRAVLSSRLTTALLEQICERSRWHSGQCPSLWCHFRSISLFSSSQKFPQARQWLPLTHSHVHSGTEKICLKRQGDWPPPQFRTRSGSSHIFHNCSHTAG